MEYNKLTTFEKYLLENDFYTTPECLVSQFQDEGVELSADEAKRIRRVLQCKPAQPFISNGSFQNALEKDLDENRRLTCSYCGIKFKTALEVQSHKIAFHICRMCGFEGVVSHLIRHRNVCINNQQGFGDSLSDSHLPIYPLVEKRALRGYVKHYNYITNSCQYKSLQEFFDRFSNNTKNAFLRNLRDLKCFKTQINMHVTFVQLRNTDDLEFHEKILNSTVYVIINRTQLSKILNECRLQLDNLINIFEKYGSNWTLHCVNGIDIRIGIYRPLQGSCFINTPTYLQRKRCTVNIKNYDDKCFMWAVLGVLYPPTTRGNVSKCFSYKKYITYRDFTMLKFPVTMSQIDRFELANQLAVNVFSYCEVDHLLPLRISTHNYTPYFTTVNLLHLQSQNNDHAHFIGIKNIDRLLGKRNNHKKVLCFNCLNRISPKQIEDHTSACLSFKTQKIKMPKETNRTAPTLKFTNYKNILKRGYVAYCDFECMMQKKAEFVCKGSSIEFDLGESSSFTNYAYKHIPTGYSIVIIDYKGELFYTETYRGKDAVDRCLQQLDIQSKRIFEIYSTPSELEMSVEDELEFASSTHCYICKEKYTDKDVRVRDHCHLSRGDGSNYRGSAHSNCNILLAHEHILPVFFHNFKSYDSHIILKAFRKYGKRLSVVPNNTEKFLSISADYLMFLDSMSFLPAGLDKLVNTLVDSGESKFNILKEHFGDKYKYILRKGVFPYEYIDSWEKFNQVKFPRRREFYSSLKDEHISRSDYKYGKYLYYKIFKCSNLGEWHDLYLTIDSFLLACVFEDFRNMSYDTYGLDPTYYYSSPGFAFDCALKITKVELELFTKLDDYMFIERGMRGGVSMIPKRKSDANNKYMESYNPNELSKFLIYLDFNNLYGWSMSQLLPEKNFKWLSNDDTISFDIFSCDDDGDMGYIIECDLDYKIEKHDEHNCFPLAPEPILVNRFQLGQYQNKLINSLNININEKQKRLIPHLGARKNYIVHYRNLKFYLKHGMVLTKIHRVLSFTQSFWLKEFILLNTKLRAKAKSTVEQDFFKGMNNFIFGKTCENKRNRLQIKLINNAFEAQRMLSKSNFETFNRITRNLYTFSMKQRSVTLDKPCYLGFTILDLAKLAMYEFHYEKIKVWYGNNVKLCMTDTDSFLYEIQTNDLYKDLLKYKEHFDFSNYSTGIDGYDLHDQKYKKMIGKMKDELGGKVLVQFVGLQAKAYSTLTEKDKNNFIINKKATKGVLRSVVRKKLKHKHMMKVFTNQLRLITTSKAIRSKKHKVFTTEICKSALHAYDSKRYILLNGIDTLSWGHFKLNKNQKSKK